MIKENKKNKLVTFLCACLMVCASALGLVQAVGTTLASSPTEPVITIDSFNYQQTDYLSNFDSYANRVQLSVQTFYNYTFYLVNNNIPSFTASSFKYYVLTYNNTIQNVTSGYSGISSVAISGSSLITGLNSSSLSLVNWSVTNQPAILVVYNGSTYFTIANHILANQHIAWSNADMTGAYNNGYNAGLQDGYTDGYGEGELDGYENGYQEGQDFGYGQGVTQGQNNVINNPNNYNLYTEEQYQQNYINGQNSVINNPNAFGLYTLTQYNDNYTAGYFAGQQQGYEDGYIDGKDDGIEIGYQQGLNSNTAYVEGQQFVVDNPSLFDLYTEADMEQRYLEGFNDGLRTSREGILYNSHFTGSILYRDNNSDSGYSVLNISQYIINSNGVYTLSNGFYNAYNDILSNYTIVDVSFNIDGGQISVDTFKALGFIMTDTTLINVITTTGIDRTTTFNVDYYVYDDIDVINEYSVVYRIIPVIENNLIVNYELDYDIPTELLNKRVHTINFKFADNLGNIPLSLLTNFSVSDINNLAYNAGYDNGYNDAMNSNIVDNAYDRGYTDGNRVGYQQGLSNGLANSNDYTFFGLIGAVIDAPIQYLSSLFNFNVLGFNLLAFITSLFTVCVIIWIVKMLLGGK